MKISENGLKLIIDFEGFCPKATKAVKTEKYYTIGYGHYGKDVNENQSITKEQALKLLKKDMKRLKQRL